MHADATTYAWGGVVAQGVAMVIGIAATRPRLAGLLDTRTTARAFKLGIPIALGNLSYFVLNAGDRSSSSGCSARTRSPATRSPTSSARR